MTRRAVFTTAFLAVTALAVGLELVAAFDGDDQTDPWTQLLVRYVPAPITYLAIAVLILWLPGHFLAAYAKRRGLIQGETMIERKVKWATAGAFAAGLVVAVLNAVLGNPSLLSPLPPWLAGLIVTLAPGLVAFLAGYQAPHTDRSPTG